MDKKGETMNYVTSVIRALITSRKPPVGLKAIINDYHDVEGQPLPFRELGYKSAQEMLTDTNAFTFQTVWGEVHISAKYNEKTAHIASMVKKQKTSSRRPAICARPAPPRSYRASVASNSVAYRQPPIQKQRNFQAQQQPPQQQQQEVEHLRRELEQRLESVRQHEESLKRLQKQQEEQQQVDQLRRELDQRMQAVSAQEEKLKQLQELLLREQAKYKEDLQRQQDQIRQEARDLKAKRIEKELEKLHREKELELEAIKRQQQQEQQQREQIEKEKQKNVSIIVHSGNENNSDGMDSKMKAQNMRPILGNSAPAVGNGRGTPGRNGGGGGYHQRGPQQQHQKHQQPPPSSSPFTPSSSVNNRLKLKQMPVPAPITPPATPEMVSKTKPKLSHKEQPKAAPSPPALPVAPKRKVGGNFLFDSTVDPVTSLALYCKAHGLENPQYQIFGSRNSYQCSVRINVDVYSSYPAEFPNELAAHMATARIAIDRISFLESRKHLSISTMKDEDFLETLYEELLKYPHGILGHRLEQWYEETFKHLLPSHWYDLISEYSKIRIEHGISPKIIVFANPPEAQAAAHQQQLLHHSSSELEDLPLPWLSDDGTQDWSMYITHCDSTQHVWARLIDHNSSFETLTEHMNKEMLSNEYRIKVLEPQEQEIYLVEVSDVWNRVRVLEVDAQRRTCRCHFVDFGDVVSFDFNDLYLCGPHFLVVPCQAVCLSMYALEKFEDHPYAYDVLCKELSGQSVVARILTTQKQYLEQGGHPQGLLEKSKRKACLVGTFYDTSTAEDVHLNDLVVKEITQSTRPPRLNLEQKSNPVLAAHINDMGDLMVLIRNDDLKFVERSIANTVAAGIDEKHRVQYSDLLRDNLVFVCDESAGVDAPKQWYRGMLTSKPKNQDEETFDIYYVDDGRLRKTHISNIYRLEANNLALASFPPQALRVRLHDVPPIDAQMLGSLRGLIPPRSEVLLKVMESGVTDKLPMVNIYIRGQDANAMYLCVNSAIRMEYEMMSTARVDHFDDGGLHFNPNGQLLRRSSFSSIVSSHSSASSSTNCNNNHENVAASAASVAASYPSTPPVSPQKIASIKDYEAIPAIGSYFEVRIALSINPARFAVQPYKCYNQLQRLMKDLQAHAKEAERNKASVTQCAIGQAYAAPDSENIYHRATVQQIYDEIVHVRFVDLGDDGVLAKQQLIQLPMTMRELPKMAIPAQLYGIQLADVIWSQDNCRRFRELTVGQKFIAIVRGYNKVKDEARVLCLELIDTSTPQDIKLHEILINEKHAQAAAS
ncbi:uncharacterized protein Dwil_GK17950 [Drosophila willistoni]|uniref:HTH OST-type domain-containing protein n=1 Tax=Drosophila willistoni TaxID=7260 RepID=B4N5W4_DROWI|nr:uncharacterized protein Dwil_GK17950 [Drosophila willistoni]